MENEGMRITVVGALGIAFVVLLVVVLVRFLIGKRPQDFRNSLE